MPLCGGRSLSSSFEIKCTIFFVVLFRDLMDELVIYIREAVDRKQENMRRRRRRDALRLQLVKVLENIAANCTFGIR